MRSQHWTFKGREGIKDRVNIVPIGRRAAQRMGLARALSSQRVRMEQSVRCCLGRLPLRGEKGVLPGLQAEISRRSQLFLVSRRDIFACHLQLGEPGKQEETEMNDKLFRKSSLDKVTGPEQLDDYIRVASPRLWVMLGAVVLLLAAVLVWSVTGALPTTLSLSGVGDGEKVVCYLPPEEAETLSPGMTAKAGSAEGTVSEVGNLPLSRAEVVAALQSDYLSENLGLSDWNVPVMLSVSGAPEGLCPVTVTVDAVRPISFILN